MNRRELFRNLGGIGLIGLTGTRSLSVAEEASDATAIAEPNCILTPQQTEGPFYFDAEQVRKDITEERPGVPLRLVVGVVNANACEPIRDAVVDVWHCDANGVYSGYVNRGNGGSVDAREDDFMRGVQVTNADGIAEFKTVFPGWYMGRVTHIHFKVHLDNRTMVTSQWYFSDAITRELYALDPYKARGANPTTLERDGVLGQGQLESLTMKVVKDKDDKEGKGYVAYHTVGVALSRRSG